MRRKYGRGLVLPMARLGVQMKKGFVCKIPKGIELEGMTFSQDQYLIEDLWGIRFSFRKAADLQVFRTKKAAQKALRANAKEYGDGWAQRAKIIKYERIKGE